MNNSNSRLSESKNLNNPYLVNFEKMNQEINKKPDLDIINNVNKGNYNTNMNYNTNFEQHNTNGGDTKLYKNQINDRITNFTNSGINLKKLPMNNNIRDYSVHIESKKEEFNDKLLNYNLLSSAIQSQPMEDNKIYNMGFHSKFKEDNNERFEQFSPLSCNVGFPIYKPDKTPDFTQSLEPSGYSNFDNFQNFQTNKIEQEYNLNKTRELNYERQMPVDTNQHFNFKNMNQNI
tara:strand:+ start:676 stop:1374 length:699 start_codon:yes stop_codon:yes gene_type:complete